MFKTKEVLILDEEVFVPGYFITLRILDPKARPYLSNGIIYSVEENAFDYLNEDGRLNTVPIDKIYTGKERYPDSSDTMVQILGIKRSVKGFERE